ncbi:SAYSvFN domain containing protein [Nitzschia inconspicua]|uniref:SAYSvFN domain containing protein n=1 Tax=Nitzschia inconspicua TaxID=303405 RepID=A0A9K3LVH2_9STRA|nr:SAYSvFN domain containing protein [Nitzschia inconspicua]
MVRAANQRSNGFYFTVAASFVAALLFIYYDLGVLAFVLVVFVAIFGFGFRDKFSNEETASAYSVFNKDGRSIVGGFTASQFERQMRGPLWSGNESDNPLKGPIAEHGLKNSSIGREKVPENERIRRRMAAAEAAQRRLHAKEND